MIYFYIFMVTFNSFMLLTTALTPGMPAINIAIWAVVTLMWSGAAYMRFRSRVS